MPSLATRTRSGDRAPGKSLASYSGSLCALDICGRAGHMANLILPVLLFVGFYFLLIRPQQQKLKAHRATVGRAAEGDRVLLSSGIYGTLTEVLDEAAYLELAEGIEILISRSHIQDIVSEFPTDPAQDDASEVEA